MASDAVPSTSERRYLWKLGSSYNTIALDVNVSGGGCTDHRANKGVTSYEGRCATWSCAGGSRRTSTTRCTSCWRCWCRWCSTLKTLRIILVGSSANPAIGASCWSGPSLREEYSSTSVLVNANPEYLLDLHTIRQNHQKTYQRCLSEKTYLTPLGSSGLACDRCHKGEQ